jgi:hypothetical protein
VRLSERQIIIGVILLALGGATLWLWQAVQLRRAPTVSSIPITLAAPAAATVRLYFGNRLADPKGLNCGEVYPAERAVRSDLAEPRQALDLLLAGPTAGEQALGFVSSLPAGSRVEEFAVRGDAASVALVAPGATAGSCLATAIRAQMIQTLRQFPSIRAVTLVLN